MKNITQAKLIIFTSIFLILFDNYAFFKNTLGVYPLGWQNIGFLISVTIVLFSLFIVLLTLLSSRWTTKIVLITILLVSSLTNYFMNSYGVVIDDEMIRNMLQTNINESMDLLTIKQVLYFLFLGVFPSIYIYTVKIEYKSIKKEVILKLQVIGISLIFILGSVLIFSKHYSSFLREHKPLRFTANPAYWIYSTGKFINLTVNSGPLILVSKGLDAKVLKIDGEPTKLVIVVVGEAARADHFSLNGYEKETNPFLKQENIINFSNMYACGTATAVSVPCMFSLYERSDFNYKKGISTENVLDVLDHTNFVNILWRDNNSDSKGVALRVAYENYKSSENNTMCSDGECRDVGMLIGLDEYIRTHEGKDILIVLHQMGNHGPAYYKRYPTEFEKFKPTCKTNQLEACTQEEIANAYDNALLYTDYFLSKTINFLKKYNETHKVGMIYMSDHGESLGENGIYLHGLPYFIAPDSQTKIGAFMWFGDKMSKDINVENIKKNSEKDYSHDNLFHTLLGIFNVSSSVYDKRLDITHQNK